MSNNANESVPQLKRQAKIHPYSIDNRIVEFCDDEEIEEEIGQMIDRLLKEHDCSSSKCNNPIPSSQNKIK